LGLTGRIWVCVDAVDGRKSFDAARCHRHGRTGPGPPSGDASVFKNRRAILKILAWQGDGSPCTSAGSNGACPPSRPLPG
jgi:hypothetical protein